MKPKWKGIVLLAVLLGTAGCAAEPNAAMGKVGLHQALGHGELAQPAIVQRELVTAERHQIVKAAQCYELSVAGDEQPGLSCASEDFILYTGEWSRPMAQKPERAAFYCLDRSNGQSRELFTVGECDISRLVTAGGQFFWLEESWSGQWQIVRYDPRSGQKQTIAQGDMQQELVNDIAAQGQELYWLAQPTEGTGVLQIYQAAGDERQSIALPVRQWMPGMAVSLSDDRLCVIAADRLQVYERLSGQWRSYPLPIGVWKNSYRLVQTERAAYWVARQDQGKTLLYRQDLEGKVLTEWSLPEEMQVFSLAADDRHLLLWGEAGLYQLDRETDQLLPLYTDKSVYFCQLLAEGVMIKEETCCRFLPWV